MLEAALLAIVHHLAAFLLVVAVSVEWFTLTGRLTMWELRRLQRVDLLYGISAGVVLAIGFIRALAFEKGWDFYAVNLAFQIKVGLFLAAGLVSVYPTVCFVRWGRIAKQQGAFKPRLAEMRRIRWCLKLQLLLLVGVVVCAALMAKGVGMPETRDRQALQAHRGGYDSGEHYDHYHSGGGSTRCRQTADLHDCAGRGVPFHPVGTGRALHYGGAAVSAVISVPRL